MNALLRILRSKGGLSIVEYAILLGLLAVVFIGAITALGSALNRTFGSIHIGSAGATSAAVQTSVPATLPPDGRP